jgi:phosphoenolpyruvate carboxykinase (ATP)
MSTPLNISLSQQGFGTDATLFCNLGTAPLVEAALANSEGILAKDGPLVVKTGTHTGRSVKDKYIVRDAETENSIWWGKSNVAMDPAHFAALKADFIAALGGKDKLYVADLFGGSQPEHRVNVRVINEFAWHNLFIRTLLVRPTPHELASFEPEYTIIDLPSFRADPARHGCRSETVIAVNFTEKLILIGGTAYAGEMKKSVFGILNYLLPVKGVMPMHCSANIGADGHTAVFFGLSGTGKTTLSADASRTLIGDDEHGWSDTAVFNFEGGCYAKMIRLSAEAEPEIFATTKRFGTVLENVVIDPETRELDFDDNSLAENSRGSYPIEFIPNTSEKNMGPVPKTIIFLTADAYGVLPPIARLTPDQAMYLLWRAIHAASPERLWQFVERAHCQGQRPMLVGQHRLDRWQGNDARHQPHADQGHARAFERGAGWQPEQCRIP